MTSVSGITLGMYLSLVQLLLLSLTEERPNLPGQRVVEVSKRTNHIGESGKYFTCSLLLVDRQAHFTIKDA